MELGEHESGAMPLRRTIVVGITGGIAAYKAVSVVRGLVKLGHSVHVVPTAGALRFVGRPTLEAISRNPVTSDVFDDVAEVRHVALGRHADLIVIAPATADALARMAAGLAPDLLGTTLLASTAPVLVAPAMHPQMWEHPATRANVATLLDRGVRFVGPATGALTGDDVGTGRMAEPDDIVTAATRLLSDLGTAAADAPAVRHGLGDLAGTTVLVSAGGTREPLDPVRFLGNRSSGRQGIAIAAEAARRGAATTVVAANIDRDVLAHLPENATVIRVGSAQELSDAVLQRADASDVVVMTAAVADFRPAAPRDTKLKKDDTPDRFALELVRNPDVLATLVARRRTGQLIVGFAAETEPDRAARIELGRAKLLRKPADMLVVNHVGWAAGFERDDNAIEVLVPGGRVVREASGSKADIAHVLLDLVATALT
ncbi:bifunctional phosphopantothenoylcysteine decarboxylase/phosphopantothenate--cysteine ligase CoaBC [Curtobacterium ammoniigenes]|uniref:bifunctional phosphopantothenoylcysteine decarboxylase/phosphopantothenate--cysteine ligase CoaBC n=1 Tax=Curtobacterium ammoniigenes TaxID=395387 RepID=UPI000AF39838|nr:bifunctional phosphopantothenoylcysteine decarboxylase/phosphopantothenate--cysteine ligase CoaBC [Curtobacterium ammoniigenes]